MAADYRDALTLKERPDKGAKLLNYVSPRWWEQEDEREVAQNVVNVGESLANASGDRMASFIRHARLYENCEIDTLAGRDYATAIVRQVMLGSGLMTLNVSAACVDTLAANVANKNRPRPNFLTSGGSWDQQIKARNLDKFMRGLFYETSVHEKSTQVFIVGCEFGTGFLQVYPSDDDRLDCERVLPSEIFVDDLLSQQLAGFDPLDAARYSAQLKRALRRGLDTRVAILGGGNTAMDAARALVRLGVKDVRILYRRTRAEMPAMPEEIEEAEQEGVKIEFLVAPERILGDDDYGVNGLECLRMRLGEPDVSGRRRPVPIANSEFVVDLDLVVLAIGQNADLGFLKEDDGIAITRDKRINVADVSFMTNRPGVFAAGDAVTRDKMVVIEAIGMGKQAFIQSGVFDISSITFDLRLSPMENNPCIYAYFGTS